jgi:GT2 family glycosyltransferase
MTHTISAIVPTIGRADSLTALLEALAAQSRRPDEVIIADGSGNPSIRELITAPSWRELGLTVRYLEVTPPNAVRQREAAIAQAQGSLLLLLDDDVVPERTCVAALESCLAATNAVAVSADFSNQDWPPPTTLWRWYLRLTGIPGSTWQGKVIGPLLRFGHNPVPVEPAPMEWIGSGNSLVRRDAYERAGGFSRFFLHRSTVNEDVDLGIKLARVGPIFLCGRARMAHMQAPGGRASTGAVAEDDLFNRYCVLRYTQNFSPSRSAWLVLTYFAIETASAMALALRRLRSNGFGARLAGRTRALLRIAMGTSSRMVS